MKRCINCSVNAGNLLPTAVIAADDVIAQTALRALFEKRIRVPEDLSLAGIDDIPSACMTIPALTTLRQPIREMVGEAFHLVTSHPGKARPQVDGEIVVKPELVIRESCASSRAQRKNQPMKKMLFNASCFRHRCSHHRRRHDHQRSAPAIAFIILQRLGSRRCTSTFVDAALPR